MSVSNLQDINNGFDLKCRSVETLIPFPGTGDVNGPAGAEDEYIPVYDGTSGKIIKSSTIKATGARLQGFDAFNNPSQIEFNGDISLLGFDALNIGTIAPDTVNTDLIAGKTGSVVVFNDKPQSATVPSVDDDLTNRLYVEDRLGYFYAGLSDSATVSGTTLTSLVPLTGDGSLAFSANSLSAGDSFHLVAAGMGTFANGNNLTVRLLENAVVLGSIVIDLETVAGTSWELECDFTIRTIGGAGSIVSNFDFTYQKGTPTFDFKGARAVDVGAIDTTIINNISVDAQFSGGANDMTCSLFYLKKVH